MNGTNQRSMKERTILVTGGAGYIGSVLVSILLARGYRVRVLDRLMFGGEPIVNHLNDRAFEFLAGDVRDQAMCRKATQGVDAVVHLAAIVGDPACAKEPELSRSTNLDGTQLIYDMAESNRVPKFVFASTCSNYGKMDTPDGFVTEESALAPVSLYAETKVAVERFLLGKDKKNGCKPTCLRFSTVYGLSPRVRFDLTVNEFTKELAIGRKLIVFGEQFWRPYCHVVDLARSVVSVLEAVDEDVAFEVFNVGDTCQNFTKKMIVEEIQRQIPNCEVEYIEKKEDPRDYRVNFDKIRERLGFQITKTVPEGVSQIYQAIRQGFFVDPDEGKYRNV